MKRLNFMDEREIFSLEQPEKYPYLYFPLAGEQGLKSAVTPLLGGDAKCDQNTFLLEPVSVENLHNNRSSRNFWCNIEGKGCWSVTGASAAEQAKRALGQGEASRMEAGFMWHKISRQSKEYGFQAEITSFVPVDVNTEIMLVTIKNTGEEPVTFIPTAVIPLYGRSADNLRDHRHVTSLLHRIETTKYGVEVTPTLSFDERGHQKNQVTYFVCGADCMGTAPEAFYPTVDDIVEDGGNFECPSAVFQNRAGVNAGMALEGLEAVGGLRFAKTTVLPGEEASYTVLLGLTKEKKEIVELMKRFETREKTEAELETVKQHWQQAVNVSYHTADKDFDCFMKWVSFQPMLRRLFGCSFLPHHDYGKGGRGWRDLWQDCLALLIMNPEGVRQMLWDNFSGVRMDGSNATIIGAKQGEFVADRNNITRVWMDHGVWPFMTTKLYIEQTGDLTFLEEQAAYFKDKQIHRGTKTDTAWTDAYGCWQKTESGEVYRGSILEHLMLQNLTAFYEVGEHNIIRLRGADWNDALDMAEERGESVAFTNAYAGNLKELAELLRSYQEHTGNTMVKISKNLLLLLNEEECMYASVEQKQQILQSYMETCEHMVSGETTEVTIPWLAKNLEDKSRWMMQHIRENEWVQDAKGNGWFNGYYDNHGRKVEGESEGGIRMMLTGQVFAIMSGTADNGQIRSVVQSADTYLYDESIGGYRLNTNFGEIKTDLGRMFGFSYGDKENGAVFSHMAVMYGNALYRRGFVKEGFQALNALKKQAMNFEVSRIYPGIPEYFDGKGRGLYHYLTGAASWYMLTVITEMFGVKGSLGGLMLEPKLLAEQFDERNCAKLTLTFAGKCFNISYINENKKEYGEYKVDKVLLNGVAVDETLICRRGKTAVLLSKAFVEALSKEQKVDIVLI